jgi:SAM-dependent methyltransferase
METSEVYSSKAERYARYRWDYASGAIQRIFELTGIDGRSVVADIGAGTGILTRHFIGRCGLVYAIEPNGPMRAVAAQSVGGIADPVPLPAQSVDGIADPVLLQLRDGRAEATGLPSHSVDLVTAGQALNWFDPLPAREEFRRILKADGWLAALQNVGSYGEALDAALADVFPQETDTMALMKGRRQPASFYFREQDFLQESYFFSEVKSWEQFFGSLGTASYAPDPGSPLYQRFEHSARQAFERCSTDGVVVSQVETKLWIGKIA